MSGRCNSSSVCDFCLPCHGLQFAGATQDSKITQLTVLLFARLVVYGFTAASRLADYGWRAEERPTGLENRGPQVSLASARALEENPAAK
jgi:hypothetical protein